MKSLSHITWLLTLAALSASATLPMVAGPRHVTSAESGSGGCENPTTDLAVLACSLDPGDFADYPDGQGSGLSTAQYAWQSDFWYCAADKTFYMLGKSANDPDGWIGSSFDETTEIWTDDNETDGPVDWTDSGHIYGNGGQRQDNCDIYFNKWSESFFRRKNHATGAWTQTGTAPTDIDGGNPPNNGVEGFPDLYGAGDGAMLIFGRGSGGTGIVYAYRYSDSSWNNLGTAASFREGVGVYDQVNNIWLGGSRDNGSAFIRVEADRVVDTLADPPIQTAARAGVTGMLYPHPDGSGCILLVERTQANEPGDRVWYSQDQGASWTQFSGLSHPLADLVTGPGVAIPEYDVIWHRSPSESRLWSPPTCP